MTLKPTLLLWICVILLNPARAQERVLRSNEVTESAIVDALAPPASPEPASGPRARGFAPTAKHPGQSSKHGKAGLLITFATDSATLTANAESMLDVVARAMHSERLSTMTFTVEGHADPRGSDDHNRQLSQRRAEAVVSFLVGTRGIAAERLAPIGKGSDDLINTADPIAPENRRVTFVSTRR